MPELSAWSWLTWAAVMVGQMAVVCLLLRARSYRQHPALFVFALSKTCGSLTLLALLEFCPNYYANVFYGLEIVTFVVELWLLLEIALCLVSPGIRASVQVFLLNVAGAFLVGSLLFSFASPDMGYAYRVYLTLARVLPLAGLALFLCIGFMVRILSLEWPPVTFGIATGYALGSVGAVTAMWLLGIFSSQLLSDLRATLYLGTLVIWICTLVRHASPSPADALRSNVLAPE